MTKLEHAINILPLVDELQKKGAECSLYFESSDIDFWYYDKKGNIHRKKIEDDKSFEQCKHLIQSML